MTSYAQPATAPAEPSLAARPNAPRLVAAAGLTIGGIVLAAFGIAIPIAEGFLSRGVVVGPKADVALIEALAPIASLLLLAGIVHIVVGLGVFASGARSIVAAKLLAAIDIVVGLAVVAMAAIAGTSAAADARSELAGAGLVTLVAAIVVATSLRALGRSEA